MANRKLKKNVKILLITLVSLSCLLISLCFIYLFLSRPTDKTSEADIVVNIKNGTSTSDIAKTLKERGLIRNELLFKIEAKISGKSLKASTYQFKKSMTLQEIMDIITDGNKYNPDIVKITFKEGQPIKKYALEIAMYTDNTYEDVINVINNKEYLNTLINKYWFFTDEILNENIYIGLEGYLSPNTYEFENRKVSVEKIIETMLNQTEKELEKYKNIIEQSGKTPHQYLTLASMLELEGTNTENRKMIAGVFNNRLSKGMNLGSDVTTYYALQIEMKADLTVGQFATENPYNTRANNMNGKLPVGPICNPSLSSIEASIYPTNNEYLYFVADKHGKIYYTKTISEHENKVKEIKEAGDWIW